jgi:hypothetical protein
MGYVGLLPLALAAGRYGVGATIYLVLAALGAVGVFLAFGKWNPLYDSISAFLCSICFACCALSLLDSRA